MHQNSNIRILSKHAYFFCSKTLSVCSSTVFGHSKSTATTSGTIKGQDNVFVRSYSDRLLKCDLTLDMLSENEKVGILTHTLFIYLLFYHCCMVDKKQSVHLPPKKLNVHGYCPFICSSQHCSGPVDF